VSDYERQAYRRKVGEPRVPNTLVYNGLRAAEFEPVVSKADAADLLYIGMMRDLKGPDIFIDAVAQAEIRLGRTINAVMVGDGEDLPRYRSQVLRLGLDDRIQFLEPMPARAAFALAQLVVVPSRAEAMPYIVLETLAAEKPMIATAVGGIPEIFGIGSPALTQPDAGVVGEKMSEALADLDAYRETMPQQADLTAKFGADVMAAQIEKAYFAALAG
jgi:glycosyltransferase involved in cell wall biosynthesis